MNPTLHPQVARAREAVQFAKEKLDSLIGLYRKQLQMRNLEFMSVSGTTHLIEVAQSIYSGNKEMYFILLKKCNIYIYVRQIRFLLVWSSWILLAVTSCS